MSVPTDERLAQQLVSAFQAQWQRGECVSVEAFLGRLAPSAASKQVVLDLIYKEVLLREDRGESLSLNEYQRRFPQYGSELEPMFDVHLLMRENVADRQTHNDPQTGKSSARLSALPAEKPPVIPGYDLLGPIASGGMGVIYKALQLRLNRLVAIKVIRPERLSSESAVRRFEREARIAARLAHPHIVPVFDANQTEHIHYLVMEYVEGTDLAKAVKENGPLSVEKACTCIRQAALGLQHAFEKGLVHRDLKPGNLILAADGSVKLLDLGLARLREPDEEDRSDSNLTQAGSVLGTPDYMAPEQVEDPHRADIRSDLYSLGCTLYYLLTGQVAFPGGSMIQKLDRHRWQPAPLVASLRPDVPADVAAIVARLLAKKPQDRFQTPVELASVLQPFAEVERASAIRRRFEMASASQDAPTVPRSGPSAILPQPTGRQMLGHADAVTGVVFTPDGHSCVSVSRDGTVRLWDAAAGGELGRWTAHPGGATCVAVTPDGRLVATGGRDCAIRVWELPGGRETHTSGGHEAEVTSLSYTSDGRQLLSGSMDQTVRLWSADTGKLVRAIGGTVVERHWEGVLSVSVADRFGLSGSRDKTLRLWDLDSGREVRCLRGPSLPVAAVALAPDGKLALSGGGHTVRLWDIEKGEVLRRLKGHQRAVLSVAFTANGHRGVSGGEDGMVRVWDIATGRELFAFVGHTSWVTAVAFSPDGRTVLSGSADRTLALWRLPRTEG
jgi:serine/threonine protein kinase